VPTAFGETKSATDALVQRWAPEITRLARRYYAVQEIQHITDVLTEPVRTLIEDRSYTAVRLFAEWFNRQLS
jgi:hypothetical protein